MFFLMKLKGKVVVITGASKGLGRALADTFCSEGSRVVVSARSKKELQAASRETGAVPFVANVTKEVDMNKLAEFAIKKFSQIDIWINNAGITLPHSEIGVIDPRKAHQVMEVNFFGTFYGSRAVMKIMKRKRRGIIVNIVSMSALIGRPHSALYAASKWAVRGFTESLRMALEPEHISVIAVHPGGIKTTIFGSFKPVGYQDWMEPSYVARKIVQNLKRKKPRVEIVVNK